MLNSSKLLSVTALKNFYKIFCCLDSQSILLSLHYVEMVLKQRRPIWSSLIRQLTSKIKRSTLLQDVDNLPVYEFPKSNSKKLRTYVWGYSETGALGVQRNLKKHTLAHTLIVQHPTRLQFAEKFDVIDFSAGYGFSIFLTETEEGEELLYGSGINTDSQLGYQENRFGNTKKNLDLIIYPVPIHLPYLSKEKTKIISISAGRAHVAIVRDNGTILTLGNNAYGQCGREIVEDEKYHRSNIIHQVKNLGGENDQIISTECGQDHTIFLSKAGKLFSCGWGADGQTGLGEFSSTGELTRIQGDILREKIIKVSSRGDCVLALNENGEVFGWGNTEYGQLFSSDNQVSQINSPRYLEQLKGLGKIIDIAAGGSFCLILNDQGDVFSWGYGILGFGPKVDHYKNPTQLLPALFGRNEFNPNSRVVSIYSGLFHMGAINSEDDLFTWGRNRYGCLGLGHQKDQYFPFKTAINGKVVKASFGVDHTLALCKPFA